MNNSKEVTVIDIPVNSAVKRLIDKNIKKEKKILVDFFFNEAGKKLRQGNINICLDLLSQAKETIRTNMTKSQKDRTDA